MSKCMICRNDSFWVQRRSPFSLAGSWRQLLWPGNSLDVVYNKFKFLMLGVSSLFCLQESLTKQNQLLSKRANTLLKNCGSCRPTFSSPAPRRAADQVTLAPSLSLLPVGQQTRTTNYINSCSELQCHQRTSTAGVLQIILTS